MATQPKTQPGSNGSAAKEVCPYCGQPLLNQTAIHHLVTSQRKHERELRKAAETLAQELVKAKTNELATKHAKKLEQLEEKLANRAEQLSAEKTKHQEELREQRIEVQAQAETEAARKAKAEVQTQLRKKDTLLQKLQDDLEVKSRQIEHLTADELGDLNEEQLLGELRKAFPEDQIERPGHGKAGGDILHEVRVASGPRFEKAGLIVYECKNTQTWQTSFLTQARREGATHRTPYLVVVSRAFPAKEKTLFTDNGIVVVDAARAVDLARVMRRMVVEVHRAELTADGQQAKGAELCEYLGSPEFRQKFDSVADSGVELSSLLTKERTWHEHTWAKRQSIYTEIGSKTAAIDARIETIIQKRSPSKKGKVVRLPRAS